MNFHEKDLKDLTNAKMLLENPGIVAKMTNLVGTPIENGFNNLPIEWKENIGNITQKSLEKAIDTAIFTMKDTPMEKESNVFHKVAVATSGAIGGFFGFTALAIELPISTTIMLRSIADIARSEGETISLYESKLACIEVFALGGPCKSDDASESGYFAVRSILSKSMTDATTHLSQKGLTKEGSPALIKFILTVSERFGVQVSEKVAAQAVPVLGAIGGATINTLFINHFQDMARGHFIVRRLEKKYGKEIVENKYLSLNAKAQISLNVSN